MVALISVPIVLTFHVFYKYQFEEIMTIMEPYKKDRFDLFYLKPHFRFMTWLIGVSFGYFMYKRDSKPVRFSSLRVIISWAFALGILFGTLVYPWTQIGEKSILNAAVYDSFGKLLWALSICVIILLCEKGYGGVINSFLSNSFWKPLARLSYAMYLVSFAVSKWNVGNARVNFSLEGKETVSFKVLLILSDLS